MTCRRSAASPRSRRAPAAALRGRRPAPPKAPTVGGSPSGPARPDRPAGGTDRQGTWARCAPTRPCGTASCNRDAGRAGARRSSGSRRRPRSRRRASRPGRRPARSLMTPKTIANGTNVSQVSVPTPDATPARIADGTASWSRRVTGMLTATTSSVSSHLHADHQHRRLAQGQHDAAGDDRDGEEPDHPSPRDPRPVPRAPRPGPTPR